jgi:serine/threonine protein kinase/tetratricopeptide (TPR) repeat protein
VKTTATRIAESLGDRYRVERELGQGGMATVYLALDLKHQRKVAIKVLRPELAAALGSERFLREIEISAGLHHPHILQLFDSGSIPGSVSGDGELLYYIMPFVEGESLRDRLNRERQLPIEDAVHIAREVADALSYAHSRQIVHRDIKPENILLESGHAMVADFGIARAVSAAGSGTRTQAGMARGTPSYMSPEQASGSSDIDGRSDLYSLGCVLFEMLAGRPPFTGTSVESIIVQHIATDPPPVTTFRPAVSRELAGTISRALAKAPADRFNPVAQFAEALTTGGFAAPSGASPTMASPKPSIAVLPFINLSADPENEYFSDGMTEEIINALSQVSGLRVASRTSAFAFRGKTVDIPRVGQALNVTSVLEGSVRKAGNRIRVTAQLIRVADDDHLWSEKFDRELADIFEVQDQIAQAIVQVLRVKLMGTGETALVVPATENVQAYELYLKGRFFWNKRNEEGLKHAIELFTQAIAQDPGYALAHVGLADTYNILGFYDLIPPHQAFSRAREGALAALALDSDMAEAHTSLGYLQLNHDWDYEAAERTYLRAIALKPNYSPAHQFYGNLLTAVARWDEAERQFKRAIELDPLSLIHNAGLGWVHYYAGQVDRAIAQLKKALEMDPIFVPANIWLAWCQAEQGRFPLAMDALDTALKNSNNSPAIRAELARVHALSGAAPQARAILNQLEQEATERYVPPFERALAYLALGENEKVFTLLEQAYQDRSHSIAYLAVEWRFDPIRNEPRFQRLQSRIGPEGSQ